MWFGVRRDMLDGDGPGWMPSRLRLVPGRLVSLGRGLCREDEQQALDTKSL